MQCQEVLSPGVWPAVWDDRTVIEHSNALGYGVLSALAVQPVKGLWLGDVSGSEHLPRADPCIVISNHAGHIAGSGE